MTHPALALLDAVAEDLEWLAPPPVYVGGAAVVTHLQGAVVARHHVTDDVDVVVQAILDRTAWQQLEEALRDRGWQNATEEEAPICRFLSPHGLRVDVMPEEPSVLGFSGRWYPECVRSAEPVCLLSGRTVLVAAPAPLLASKLDAYLDRGVADPLLSVDLDDIASLCLGCPRLEVSLASSPPALRAFVESTLSKLVADPRVLDAITSNLLADDPDGGAGMRVIDMLRSLASTA